ncbi:MAG: hypothetical protein MO852_06985 [Candidatus Devosia euplotis]|nr:hypothetical protein [Candidatus Devosia euplotis]
MPADETGIAVIDLGQIGRSFSGSMKDCISARGGLIVVIFLLFHLAGSGLNPPSAESRCMSGNV